MTTAVPHQNNSDALIQIKLENRQSKINKTENYETEVLQTHIFITALIV